MLESGKMLLRARVLAAGLTAFVLAGQQPMPVFRAGTKLVEVTVTVLDKKGNAVTGLESADFTILDEGKPRPISFFRFDGAPPAEDMSRPAVKLPPGIFSNRVEQTAAGPRTVNALVLDTLNTPPEQNAITRSQMMRYLLALAPQSRIGIFLMGQQIRILHDFSDDGVSLRTRLEKAKLGMPNATVTDYNRSIVEAEAFVDMFAGDPQTQKLMEELARNNLEVEAMANASARRYRMEASLAAMEALGRHMAGIPGRKNLIWIGGGFSMVAITGAMGMGIHGGVQDFESKVRETSRRLAQQGVILYIVDSKGLELPSDTSAASKAPVPVRGRGRFEIQMDTEAASNDPRPAMSLMAAITGGRYLHNTNDLAAGFKHALADMQGSYTLGFYMPGDPDDKWHRLKVRVNRSGVNLQHREGYLADSGPARPSVWTEDSWRTAFSNPIASTAIPLTAKCERSQTGELTLILVTDANALQFRQDGPNLKADLEVGMADRASDGAVRTQRASFTATLPSAQWEEALKQGIGYRRQWKPAEGANMVRVIVHDVRSGQYGSIDLPLAKIP